MTAPKSTGGTRAKKAILRFHWVAIPDPTSFQNWLRGKFNWS